MPGPKDTNLEQQPKIAVDAAVFAIDQKELKVLMIKIAEGAYGGKWCLPGGLVGYNESLEQAVKRILFQKTNISGLYLEQLYTFGDPDRDNRSRAISVAYFALVNNIESFKIQTIPYYAEVKWTKVDEISETAFDHKQIVKYALARLQAKLSYTNIAYTLLPNDFTLTELQQIYEIILQKKLDKRNFRKKIMALGLVEQSEEKLTGKPFRPAQLFHFTQKKLVQF